MKEKVCQQCNRKEDIINFTYSGKVKNTCKACIFLEKLKDTDKKNFINKNFTHEEIDYIINFCFKKEEGVYLNSLSEDLNKELSIIILLIDYLKIRSVKKIIYKCDYCSKENIESIGRYKSNHNHFCSKECHDKFQFNGDFIKCDYCGKEIYKTQYVQNNGNNHFCSKECAYEYRRKESEHSKTTKNCLFCNKEMILDYNRKNQKFCSPKCNASYYGKKREITTSIIKCDCCGEHFERAKYKTYNRKYLFCSVDCFKKWHKDYCQTENYKDKNRDNALQMLADGKFPSTNTGIQLIINGLLDTLNINYINEKINRYYSFDIFLEDYELYIEIMGGYWHCDSRKYDIVQYQQQYNRIIKDKRKGTFIKKYDNKNILYLWEDDILNNIDLCKNLILKFINANGLLKFNHSSDYVFNNDTLLLNENRNIQYSDMKKEELDNLVDLNARKIKNYWIEFKCDYCNSQTSQLKSKYNKSNKHFCSVSCKTKYLAEEKIKKRIKLNCDNCGKEYEVTYSRYNRSEQHFCSQDCFKEFKNKH